MKDDKFGRSNCDKDEARILLASFVFKKLNKVGYLTSGVKKNDQATKDSKYLLSDAKKVFKLLQYAFTQVFILQHFNQKQHIRIETNSLDYVIGKIFN